MIQIDMQMPKNCLDCPACNEYLMCVIPVNGRKWGENDVSEFAQGRPEWCPMKEQEDRKHGHWIEDDSETYTPNHDTWECSECHEPFTLNEGTPEENKFYFCPRCGSDMR